MAAKISTSSSGGWSTASLMFWVQNPIHPLLWMKVTTSIVRLCLCGDGDGDGGGWEGGKRHTWSRSITDQSPHSYLSVHSRLL